VDYHDPDYDDSRSDLLSHHHFVYVEMGRLNARRRLIALLGAFSLFFLALMKTCLYASRLSLVRASSSAAARASHPLGLRGRSIERAIKQEKPTYTLQIELKTPS
jgi:hypothetical protein